MTKSELMNHIFQHPAMYLGHASVIKMEAFINGYSFAQLAESGKIEDPLYEGFAQWIIKRFCVGQYPWSSVVSMVGIGEENAFKVAKECWEEYKNQYQEKLKQN
jgi:hypothetical protein